MKPEGAVEMTGARKTRKTEPRFPFPHRRRVRLNQKMLRRI